MKVSPLQYICCALLLSVATPTPSLYAQHRRLKSVLKSVPTWRTVEQGKTPKTLAPTEPSNTGTTPTAFAPTIRQYNKKYEIRGVWLTTVHNLDWPKRAARTQADVRRQKAELDQMLDQLKELGINTVFFQVRGRGDLLYPSAIEPQAPTIATTSLTSLGYDPLAYAQEACHSRGMRIHAWLVTLPLGNNAYINKLPQNAYAKRHRADCIFFRGEWYMDPGKPATARHLAALASEICSKYDVDGIHLDYIRYPDKAASFPDDAAYRRAKSGLSKAEWRQQNIANIVSAVHKAIKDKHPQIELSASPLGKYRMLSSVPTAGWTALDDVHQDPTRWCDGSPIDFVVPMMYYKDNLFYPFAQDWVHVLHSPVVPGIAAYRILPSEGGWSVKDIIGQVEYIQKDPVLSGATFFRSEFVANPRYGLHQALKKVYNRPALLPPVTGFNASDHGGAAMIPPRDISIVAEKEGLKVSWTPIVADLAASKNMEYAIYVRLGGEVTLDSAGDLYAITRDKELTLPWNSIPEDQIVSIMVTTYDFRSGCEAFPSHSDVYYRTKEIK